jgi:hypothetical protein
MSEPAGRESGARAETKLFYGRMLSKFINIIMTALHQYYSVIIAAYVLARSLSHINKQPER